MVWRQLVGNKIFEIKIIICFNMQRLMEGQRWRMQTTLVSCEDDLMLCLVFGLEMISFWFVNNKSVLDNQCISVQSNNLHLCTEHCWVGRMPGMLFQ